MFVTEGCCQIELKSCRYFKCVQGSRKISISFGVVPTYILVLGFLLFVQEVETLPLTSGRMETIYPCNRCGYTRVYYNGVSFPLQPSPGRSFECNRVSLVVGQYFPLIHWVLLTEEHSQTDGNDCWEKNSIILSQITERMSDFQFKMLKRVVSKKKCKNLNKTRKFHPAHALL